MCDNIENKPFCPEAAECAAMTCNSDVFAVKIVFPEATLIGVSGANTRVFLMCRDKARLPNNAFGDYLKRIP